MMMKQSLESFSLLKIQVDNTSNKAYDIVKRGSMSFKDAIESPSPKFAPSTGTGDSPRNIRKVMTNVVSSVAEVPNLSQVDL